MRDKVGVDVFHACCYLQKPSLEEMNAENVILPSPREIKTHLTTLIDTGLVIACGDAFEV